MGYVLAMNLRTKPHFAIAACLLLAACDKPAAPTPQLAPEPAPASAAAPVETLAAPTEQTALVAVIASDNCTKFSQVAAFDGWVVTIDDFETSTVNGSIDITFGAGQHVSLEQVVQSNDPLYATVAALRQGSTVRISGHFSHGNGECNYRLDKVGITLTKVG